MLPAIIQDVAGIQGFERLPEEACRTENIPEIGGATSVGEAYEYKTCRQRQISRWTGRYGNRLAISLRLGLEARSIESGTTRGFLIMAAAPTDNPCFWHILSGMSPVNRTSIPRVQPVIRLPN